MKKHLSLLLLLLLAPLPLRAAPESRPVISRITIRSTDIFDFETKTYLKKFPYTWINGLHIKTKEWIIRQELLFKVGDRYDPFLAAETERNLRALSFIRAARVARYPQRDGTVALVVYASDAWTTEPQINLGGINKVDKVEIGFKEKNLLGFGKTIEFFYNKDGDVRERRYGYFDPRLFHTRWQLEADYINRSDGETQSARLNRPFFSADTKWSGGGSYENDSQVLDEFDNSVKVSEFERTKEISETSISSKIGGGRKTVNHLGLRYRKELHRFSPTPETVATRPLPRPNDFQTVFTDLETLRNNFIEITRLEKMTRVEDLNLGPVLRLSPGFSPRRLTGRDDAFEMAGSYEQKALTKRSLFSGVASYGSRDTFEDRPDNQRQSFDLRYYGIWSHDHTLVVRTRFEWGDRLDAGNEIVLGSENGLRGFKRDSIVGDKSWILNIEDRLFFIEELWDLFSVGGVVFYDTGYSWSKGRPVALSRVVSEVGMGLRLGLTRSSNEVILRMDFAYKPQRFKSDDSEFVFVFGSGQAF